jgi:hypothetical protein
MVVRYGRLGVLGCVLAIAALAIAVTPASPRPASPKLDTTLTATITGGSAWCCGKSVDFEGSAVVTSMGRVDVTGRWLGGCSFFTVPSPCFRRLDLTLVARNGDRLTIVGNDEWTRPFDPAPEVTTWASDPARSSGRFADLTASGTYTFHEDPDGSTARISLAGTSHRQGLS